MSITIGRRLKELRQAKGLLQSQVAKELGITQSAYSHIESGQTSVSVDYLKTLVDLYESSSSFVIDGERSSYRNHLGFIPYVDNVVKAGYVKNYGSKEFLHTIDYYKIPGFEKGNFRIFEVDGHSMEPTLFEKELIVCEHCDIDDRNVTEGTLCVFLVDKDLVVKRIFNSGDDKSKLILKSDNMEFEPYAINVKDIKEMWIVKAKISDSFVNTSKSEQVRISKLEEDVDKLRSSLEEIMTKIKK